MSISTHANFDIFSPSQIIVALIYTFQRRRELWALERTIRERNNAPEEIPLREMATAAEPPVMQIKSR